MHDNTFTFLITCQAWHVVCAVASRCLLSSPKSRLRSPSSLAQRKKERASSNSNTKPARRSVNSDRQMHNPDYPNPRRRPAPSSHRSHGSIPNPTVHPSIHLREAIVFEQEPDETPPDEQWSNARLAGGAWKSLLLPCRSTRLEGQAPQKKKCTRSPSGLVRCEVSPAPQPHDTYEVAEARAGYRP